MQNKKTIMGVAIACSLFIIFVIQYSCTHETIGERNYRWQKEISNRSTKEYRLYEIKDSMNRFRDEIPDSEYNNLINRLR